MKSQEPRTAPAQGPTVQDSREVLEPLGARRALLHGGAGQAHRALVAPQIARLEEELSLVRKALRAQRAETRVEKQNNELLRAELRAFGRITDQPDARPLDGGASVERLKQAHREEVNQLRQQYEARALELEARCARELGLLEEKYAAKINALRNSLNAAEELTLAKTERIRRLEARLSRVQVGEAEVRSLAKPTTKTDDLTALRGVGPVYALALRRCGVVSLAQIAAWTLEDIRAIAPQIGTTEARILREQWVPEARKISGDQTPASVKGP